MYLDMLQVEDMAWTDNGQKEILQMRHWLKERNIDELARTPLEAEELEEVSIQELKKLIWRSRLIICISSPL